MSRNGWWWRESVFSLVPAALKAGGTRDGNKIKNDVYCLGEDKGLSGHISKRMFLGKTDWTGWIE